MCVWGGGGRGGPSAAGLVLASSCLAETRAFQGVTSRPPVSWNPRDRNRNIATSPLHSASDRPHRPAATVLSRLLYLLPVKEPSEAPRSSCRANIPGAEGWLPVSPQPPGPQGTPVTGASQAVPPAPASLSQPLSSLPRPGLKNFSGWTCSATCPPTPPGGSRSIPGIHAPPPPPPGAPARGPR